MQPGSSALVASILSADPQGPAGAPRATLNVVWQCDPDKLLETDFLYHLLRRTGFAIRVVVDLKHEWTGAAAIVVTNGRAQNGVSMRDYLDKFRSQGLKVGVFHVCDEFSREPVDFYDRATFVFRQFVRPGVMHLPNVHYLPSGYKNGFKRHLAPKPIAERRYVWSFAGFVRGRLSRRSMIRHAQTIPGGTFNIGSSFNDSSALSFEKYVAMMCDTTFALAPAGNRHVESYRFYEAIVAGAIPVVEVQTIPKLLLSVVKDMLSPFRARTYGTWTRQYWREVGYWLRKPNMWTQVYGPDFPCPQLKSWRGLRRKLASIDPVACAASVQLFWAEYEATLVGTIVELSQLHLHA